MPPLLAAVLLAGGTSLAQDDPTDRERALAAIRKLGADVIVDPTQRGAPVAVVLAGANTPADCLPHLKDLGNVQSCNL
jgi:hypothetical protein